MCYAVLAPLAWTPLRSSLQHPVLLAASSSASRPTTKVDKKSPERRPGAEDLLTQANLHQTKGNPFIL